MLIYGTEHERQHEERLRLACLRYLCKDAGICTKCRKAPARAGMATCLDCAAKHAAQRGEHKRRGPRDKHEALTEAERKRRKALDCLRRRNERRDAGLCYACGKPLDNERWLLCVECHDKQRANYLRWTLKHVQNGKGGASDENG